MNIINNNGTNVFSTLLNGPDGVNINNAQCPIDAIQADHLSKVIKSLIGTENASDEIILKPVPPPPTPTPLGILIINVNVTIAGCNWTIWGWTYGKYYVIFAYGPCGTLYARNF